MLSLQALGDVGVSGNRGTRFGSFLGSKRVSPNFWKYPCRGSGERG